MAPAMSSRSINKPSGSNLIPHNPKTPSRQRAQTLAFGSKTPLTPSLLNAMNNMAMASGPGIPFDDSPLKLHTKPTRATALGGGARATKGSTTTTNAYDVSNPFIARPASRTGSRPASPTKRGAAGRSTGVKGSTGPSRSGTAAAAKREPSATRNKVAETLKKQAGAGVIRKGGAESRIEVVQMDGPAAAAAAAAASRIGAEPRVAGMHELKRSKSTSAMGRPMSSSCTANDQIDRFITSREPNTDIGAVAQTLEHLSLGSSASSTPGAATNTANFSPGHTARLAAATGMPLNRRILGYAEAPPAASSSVSALSADTALSQQREYAKPLYAQRPGAASTATGGALGKGRKISTVPERVLDAPGMVDDFYLNLISWSTNNQVAVALESATFVWDAGSGEITEIGEAPEGSYVSSVSFSNDGSFLGVGHGTGEVELWDVETGQKLRTMAGHVAQVATLSWNKHILSSGCGDGSIWHHDVRVPQHKVMELLGHTGEVCGLTWRADGELLASGGNDNVVNIWDGRVGDATEVPNGGTAGRGTARWTKRNHTAAVKAVAWCPWQPSLLATGGGTNDATIHVWNSTTGARLHTLRTPSQITSLQWAPHRKELLSTHGYPTNSIMVHAYPSMERVAEIRDAHDSRVLFSAVGPAGDVVVTGAGDENLKFWRIWDLEAEKVTRKKVVKKDLGSVGELGGGIVNPTKQGILSLR